MPRDKNSKEEKKMKWIITLIIVLAMITPAVVAGESLYISVVGRDIWGTKFYVSENHQQFMYDESLFADPHCWGTFPSAYNYPFHTPYGMGCEQFRSKGLVNQPEICDTQGTVASGHFSDRGNDNALTKAGSAGYYEWYVRLAMAPSGEINLVFQCGVLKPNAFALYYYNAIELCAAETGERVGPDCSRQAVDPGINPLIVTALPTITAIAYPGPYNSFTPFNLTAFRNPGSYDPFAYDGGPTVNGEAGQILNGTDIGTRILLKACMDKTVVVKLPVSGQTNALGQYEWDLEAADLIYVRMDIPRQNTVDVYCHEQSLKVMGVGMSPF
jgi:hypothetical protein